METSRELDARIDPNMATRLLLELAQERSVDSVLEKLLCRGVERPDMACLQVWFIESGWGDDRKLRMRAGTGKDGSGELVKGPPFFDSAQRILLGEGFIGRAAATGRAEMVFDIEKRRDAEEWPEWFKEARVRSFGATPIQYKGEVLGVMAGYSMEVGTEEAPLWGQIFADHIGAAIANSRAFEEIERLKAQLELQNTYLQEEVVEAKAFGSLVGQGEALRQTMSQIDLVAPTEASVLILGETGTGKELVAHEIHRRSNRKDRPLVRVNCASIPRDLYESEFFGHVKGAFTGAIKDRAGRFEAAEGGSLFLDEIGEIPMELQGKLLRVLQEKRYERVGEERSRVADVRIIGATNRDLKKEIAAGRFRQDLYFRLHVFPIEVVPLRERLEDVPLLAEHFVELSVRELRCARPRLTRAGVVQLQGYAWPGNVRELRNVIQRAVILARGGPLQFDLPSAAAAPRTLASHRSAGEKPERKFLTETEMRQRERDNLVAVLEKTGWKVMGSGGAAELLGVKATTLFSRMKKWGLRKPDGCN